MKMEGYESKLYYPKVSIIIPNFRSLKDTTECLDSLRKIAYPNYGVIVVQLKSAEGDAKVLRDNYGDYIHLIEMDEDIGIAGTNNIGITYALNEGADYVLLLMNDVVVDPEFLTEMVKVAESRPETGLLSPMIYSFYQPDELQYPYELGSTLPGLRGVRNIVIQLASGIGLGRTKLDRFNRLNFSVGGASLIKRSLLETIGLLDPAFFWLAEDVDLWLRAVKAGFDFSVVPNARIWHKGRGKTRAKTPFPWYYTARSPIILARKHFKPFPLGAYFAFLTIFQIPKWFLESIILTKNTKLIPAIARGVRDGLNIDLKRSREGQILPGKEK